MHLTVTVPATTANLGPGFDCLGLALALYNTLEVRPREDGLLVTVEGEGQGLIALDHTNMMVEAMQRLFTHTGHSLPGLHLRQINHIPVSSGLGSSAAAALAGLLAANRLLREPLTPGELLDMAVDIEGHPDNMAPALYGGLVLANSDGEHLLVEHLPIADQRVVVVLPHFSLPTVEARAVLPRQISFPDAIFNVGRMAMLVRALAEGDYAKLDHAMQDRLHQPYRVPLIPGMQAAFRAARAAGAQGVALSGAGPGVIAFASENHEAIAEAMRQAFGNAGLDSRAWILDIDRHGSRIT
ncbi:MAG TPA: homoserine kinase [Candidatus Binatia bacterium]|nr:homoserine kinase [Candidatus Binatia bacterium]